MDEDEDPFCELGDEDLELDPESFLELLCFELWCDPPFECLEEEEEDGCDELPPFELLCFELLDELGFGCDDFDDDSPDELPFDPELE